MERLRPRKLLDCIDVRSLPGDPSRGRLIAKGLGLYCALGRCGITAMKREGDGATPLAQMRVLGGFVQSAHWRKATALGLRRAPAQLGWCDAPGDRNYNRAVRLPYAASAEPMCRDDGLYDICLVLDWNIRPRRMNAGSAIFVHLARPGYLPTDGCIALTAADMRRLLPFLSWRTVLRAQR